ncbi:hypothetical protein RCH09_003399 [Actimicrobium sp. GrIS 1.19]|uniref:hypothetical protein n=1 Tax=Actimicrobium sp. GrIS 1.19 TaxID=3071708 RepID=UPI002E0866DA|nr:hypothetical protein [Actimicrobium sp. GrIS 1.19]
MSIIVSQHSLVGKRRLERPFFSNPWFSAMQCNQNAYLAVHENHNRYKSVSAKLRMNKGLLLLIGVFLSHPAHADETDVQRGLGAAAGIFAAIYVHELGHASVFYIAGADEVHIRVPGTQCMLLCGQTDVKWSGNPTQATRKLASGAGFVTSNLAAELLLHSEGGARSAFGQGFIATNLYSNVSHVFTYYTNVRGKNGYQGNDIDSYELAGGNPHLLAAGLVSYSLYALRRMERKNIPVMFARLRF